MTGAIIFAALVLVICRIFGLDPAHTVALTAAAFVLGICNGVLDLLQGPPRLATRPAVQPSGAAPVMDMAFALTRRGHQIGPQSYDRFATLAAAVLGQWRRRHPGEAAPAPATLAALDHPETGPAMALSSLAACMDELEYLNGSRPAPPREHPHD
ncbi:MAG: hypothetical protein ACHP7K_05035 [Actinomycetales bacterium]